jgi:hypothetical protein
VLSGLTPGRFKLSFSSVMGREASVEKEVELDGVHDTGARVRPAVTRGRERTTRRPVTSARWLALSHPSADRRGARPGGQGGEGCLEPGSACRRIQVAEQSDAERDPCCEGRTRSDERGGVKPMCAERRTDDLARNGDDGGREHEPPPDRRVAPRRGIAHESPPWSTIQSGASAAEVARPQKDAPSRTRPARLACCAGCSADQSRAATIRSGWARPSASNSPASCQRVRTARAALCAREPGRRQGRRRCR